MKRNFTFMTAAIVLLTFLAVPLGMRGQTTYQLQQVTSVEAGGLYVFEQGGYVMKNTVSSSALQTTNAYSTTGLVGTEIYVWTLETATNGFYMKNVSLNSNQYLNNSSSTGVSLGNKSSIWAFNFQTDNTVCIQNTSNSNRFLGYTSSTNHSYKAYATSNLSGNSYPHAIKVYKLVEEGGSSVTTPTITPASCNFTGTKEITITPASGTTMYYTTNGTDPDNTLTGYTTAQTFSITETTTVKAIAYDGSDHSSIVSATYTYFTPLTTMQQIFDAATSTATTVAITFDNWVVSGINYYNPSTMAFVTDGNGKGCVIYNTSGHGFAVGNTISGTVICSLQKIYGYARINDITASDVTVNTAGTVNVSNIDLANLAGVNTGALVSYENLECTVSDSKYYLTDGATSLQVYKALWDFTYSDHLVAGKTYNITGIYQQYTAGQSDTKEILPRSEADIEEVVITNPVINASSVNIAYDATSGAIAYTIENSVAGITLGATCDAAWVSSIVVGAESVTFTTTANEGDADRTATFTLTYTGAQNKTVTVTQGHYVPDYATLPFEYDGNGTGDLPNGFTVSGLGTYNSSPAMKFDGTGDYAILKFNEHPGTLTFDIKGNTFSGSTFKVQTSEDGTTYTDLQTYTELGETQSEEFTNLGENVRYIKWIYTNKSSGNVGLGNIALAKYVAPNPAITVASTTITATAEETSGTLNVTCTEIETEVGVDVLWFESDGTTSASQPDWMIITDITFSNINYLIYANNGEARTAYFKLFSLDADANDVYSDLVTITQAAYVAPPTPGNWVLTSLADLTEDDVFVIVGNNGDTYAMTNDNGTTSAPAAVTVTVVEGTLSAEPAANLQWNISITDDGYTFYPNGETETWLYCTNTNNGVRVGTGDAKHFTLDEGYLITTETSDQRYIGIYNSQDWRCYKLGTDGTFPANIANQTFSFYKKVADYPVTYTKQIAQHGATTADGGWHLIASPVASVTPSTDNGFIATTPANYDLYYFDQSAEKEWKNFKANSFDLVSGKGYLYANGNENGTTLTFTGTPYSGNGEVTLTYIADAEFAGFNLIGNPFSTAAIINMPFYRMNGAGTAFVASTESGQNQQIAAMEGVFVYAYDEGQSQAITTATFTASRSGNAPQGIVNLNVERNASVVDNAIVRFDGGLTLPKFMFNEDNTKLYIPQNGKDYAIVSAQANGEMPVSFKATENGTYTLTVSPEGVEMNYLHLIDNMTGMDVDLLQTPSYTFDATTRDYESRFRLVFNANNTNGADNAETFAYYNGSEWVIANDGTATLQVVDMMGRIVSTQTVNGNTSLSTNGMSTGVYVMRLVNGNDVKTQKIVVR